MAEPTATVFFGRGRYDAAAIHETTRSLVWQAAGIWAVASVRTIVPMFHAHNDTRTPVIASAPNLVAFMSLSLALMGAMCTSVQRDEIFVRQGLRSRGNMSAWQREHRSRSAPDFPLTGDQPNRAEFGPSASKTHARPRRIVLSGIVVPSCYCRAR